MIELKNIDVTFQNGSHEFKAVDNVSLKINKGEIFGIVGPSGAGKSTLVRVINLLQRPTNGEVIIEGSDITKFNRKQLRKTRLNIGMIFQHFNLLEQQTVLENVCFPLEIRGVPKKERREKALELLEKVGLADKANAYPAQLSGGQKQRVAIARVFLKSPPILILDEATSALDSVTEARIQGAFDRLAQGRTTLIIAHRLSTIRAAHRILVIQDGVIAEEGSHAELLAKNGVYARLYRTQNLGE
mgnify:CR=1 FL=1